MSRTNPVFVLVNTAANSKTREAMPNTPEAVKVRFLVMLISPGLCAVGAGGQTSAGGTYFLPIVFFTRALLLDDKS